MVTHFSIPSWKVPWTEGPGGLQSMELQRGNADGQQAHEKMLNATNHQGNTNQKRNEIITLHLSTGMAVIKQKGHK